MGKDQAFLGKIDSLVASIRTSIANMLSQGLPNGQLTLPSSLERIEKYAKKKKKGDCLAALQIVKQEWDILLEGIKANDLSNLKVNLLKAMLDHPMKTEWPDPQPGGDATTLIGNAQVLYAALFELRNMMRAL
jgi:hypothetical protein